MKACGLIGSPVKGGNVDLLVRQVLDGAAARGAETRAIDLNELAIRPCQSCGADPSPSWCCLDDDMQRVYGALEESEVVVLGSPVYFDTVSAQVKLMIDRCNCLAPLVRRPDGTVAFDRRLKPRKHGVLVAVAGAEQDFETLRTTAAAFFSWIHADLVETLFYGHDDEETGGVRGDEAWMKRAFDAGARAAEAATASSE